jgi:autotransporter family porin
MRLSGKKILLLLFFSLLLCPLKLEADTCNPDGTITGSNTSTITLGVGSCATASGNTAEVVAGATIIPAAGDGIVVGTNAAWTITNNGTINCSNGNGISAPGSGAGPITLTNTQTIESANLSGVVLQGGGTVVNQAGALIQGAFTGISFSLNGSGSPSGGPSMLDNSGTIRSTTGLNDAVVFNLGGTAINRAGGLIDGGIGLAFNDIGTVENSGQIGTLANTNSAIDFNGGTITNNEGGQILAQSRGIDAGTANTTVNNSGLIEASQARAISMSAGGSVTNNSSGVISAGSRAIFIDGGVGTVVNAGSITGGLVSATPTIELHVAGSSVTNSGTINGDVQFFASNDSFLMTAGQMTGQLLMGTLGNETATFDNVTDANIGTITVFNGGGGGGDVLNFNHSQHTGGSDLVNWETINLNSNSVLSLSSNLTLGGTSSDTTATLNISSSTLGLALGNQIISSSSANPVNVVNAGLIDLSNGGSNSSVTDTLTIRGNYISQGGRLTLNTQVGGDASPSEKLIFDGSNGGSTVTGTTTVTINNIGGTGAQTVQGILVIESLNGAITGTNTFLLGSPLRVGAFDYRLVKGSGAFAENWYLRSMSEVSPFIGPEISVYADPHPAMFELNLLTLGTLHQRVGEEENLRCLRLGCRDTFNGVWVRSFGKSAHNRYQSLTDPRAHGWMYGFQGGMDLFRQENAPVRDHIGVLTSYAHDHHTISGLVTDATGTANLRQHTGNLKLELWNLGSYWTHFGPSGWYLDGVVQFGWARGSASSTRTGIRLHGTTATASLEGGYPICIKNALLIEPEAQLVYLYSRFNKTSDSFSTISLGNASELVGRIGLRMQYNYFTACGLWQPYLKANWWDNFHGHAITNYAGVSDIGVDFDTSWIEAGGGFTFRHHNMSFYGEISYNQSLKNHKRFDGLQGNFGVRYNW